MAPPKTLSRAGGSSRGELEDYGAGLVDKPEVIALTKADLLDDKERAKIVNALQKEAGTRVFPISAPLEDGMEALLDTIIEQLGTAAAETRLETADQGTWSPL